MFEWKCSTEESQRYEALRLAPLLVDCAGKPLSQSGEVMPPSLQLGHLQRRTLNKWNGHGPLFTPRATSAGG